MSSQSYSVACENGKSTDSYWPLCVAQYLQILLSGASIAFVLKHLPWENLKNHKLPAIHPNFTILLSNGLFLYFIHAFFIFLTSVIFQIKYFSVPECSFTMITWKCLALRVPVYSAIIGLSFLHLFFFLERCLATIYLKHYASHSAKFGIISCFVICPIAIIYDLYVVKDDELFAYKSYCVQTSPKNSTKMFAMFFVLLAIDVFTSIGDLILQHINQKQQKRRVVDYNLLKSYQIAENETATKVLLRLSLFHSLTFTSYLLTTVTARYWFASAGLAIYVFAIEIVHLLICLNILCTLVIAGQLKESIKLKNNVKIVSSKEQADIYFNQFASQISVENLAKNNMLKR